MPSYVAFFGSGTNNGIGLGVDVAAWKVGPEKGTLSPAAMVSVEGMNWLRRTGNFRNPPGISLCSPRNTVYVLVADDAPWAPRAIESTARAMQAIRTRLTMGPPRIDCRNRLAPAHRDAAARDDMPHLGSCPARSVDASATPARAPRPHSPGRRSAGV